MKYWFITVLALALVVISCKEKTAEIAEPEVAPVGEISSHLYGYMPDSTQIDEYVLKNAKGMEVKIITYGGIITSWTSPDKYGAYANVVLGYDNLSDYLKATPYFGALIGRYGNRIAKGKFSIDGQTYKLPTNDGANSLHGGDKGFDKVVWTADESMEKDGGATLLLSYLSPDNEMGYPGNLDVKVRYTLTADNALEVDYSATTDKPTVVNLTQHSYFNLSADFRRTILDHQLLLPASAYLPVDAGLIPTGELKPVSGTPFDFTLSKTIGQDISNEDDQLEKGKGYDHCWVVDGEGMRPAATLYHEESGRVLEISSTEPAIQFYSGNFLDGTLPKPGGGTYSHRTGLCLETQHYPDSPNQEAFPSTRLNPGETYSTKTIFKFSSK